MNQRQLASVLFAVVGVLIAASRLPDIFFHAILLFEPTLPNQDAADPLSQSFPTILALGTLTVAVLVGCALVVFRDRLANRLFPAGNQSLAALEVQAVAFSVLGCYFVVQGISGIRWAGQLSWGAVTQIVFGVALFFGARGLSRLWSLARTAGTSHNAPERAV